MASAGALEMVVWPLAAGEAASGSWPRIEPAHLMSALLKFAEIDIAALGDNVPAAALDTIRGEQGDLKSALGCWQVAVPEDSTRIRRKLRGVIGEGGTPHDGERTIHRSDASRALFRRAGERATAQGAGAAAPAHLLDAILEAPPPEISALFPARAKLEKPDKPAATPLLDRLGRMHGYLSANKAEVGTTDAAVRIVRESLLASAGTSLLLVQAGRRQATEVVAAIVSPTAPPREQRGAGLRLIELDAKRVVKGGATAAQFEERMVALIDETRTAGDVVLMFPRFSTFVGARPTCDVSSILKNAIRTNGLRCVATVDEAEYVEHIKADRDWSSLLRPVWIHDIELPKSI